MMAIYKYFLKRLLLTIPTLVGVSIIVFLLIHMIPGDPLDVMLGDRVTEEARIAFAQRLGLDKPLYVQYWQWFTNAIQGDFGQSIRSNEQVYSEIISRLPATIELTIAALLIAIVFGIFFGVTAARYRNTIIDQSMIGLSLLGVSIPIFWLGMMMIFLFAVLLGWLPVSGRIAMGASMPDLTGFYLLDSLLVGRTDLFIDSLKHLVMPAAALATVSLSLITRITRSSMLDVLGEDYVRTARAKGLPMRKVIYKHALKNAMIPVVTVIGLQFAKLMGGAILTEVVFSWPGIGRLLITGIAYRDYPMVQGIVFFVASAFILVNILVDLYYAYLDPRIRYE
jgi:ABC-type dipeptide/oligopeptide/nickel transport system permease component